MQFRLILAAPFVMVIGGVPLAWGVPNQGSIPSGTALANACGGNDFGGAGPVGYPGTSFSVGTPANASDQQQCVTVTGSIGSSVSTGAVSSPGVYGGSPLSIPATSYSNGASASVTTGAVHLSASSSGAASTNFAGAVAQGGFNQTFTPGGGTPGTSGVWVVPIISSGVLTTTGPNALALAEVQVYANGNLLTASGGGVNATAYNQFVTDNSAPNPFTHYTQVGVGAYEVSWDYEMQPFEANSNTSESGPDTLTVNNTTLFAIPVVFGTPITLGIYGLVEAAEDASSDDTTPNGSGASFGDTIAWGGMGYAYQTDDNGNIIGGPVADFSLNPTGDIDYDISYAPEPTGLSVFGAALAVLGVIRRRRARRAARPTAPGAMPAAT
jgi:hypothetical protein